MPEQQRVLAAHGLAAEDERGEKHAIQEEQRVLDEDAGVGLRPGKDDVQYRAVHRDGDAAARSRA